MRRRFAAALAVLMLLVAVGGCGVRDADPGGVLRKYGLPDRPEPERFAICSRFGCRGTTPVRLEPSEWTRVGALFQPRPESAAAERVCIARAVALLETLVGGHTATWADVAMNRAAGPGQLDCVAESVNTSIYLLMLQDRGLLRHHRVEAPRRRGVFIFYPHNTAVIRDRADGAEYAVDSWFRDNGEPPYIVPLAEWLEGWHPRDETAPAMPGAGETQHGI